LECPYCGNQVVWEMQNVHGASATPRCSECGEWFHAHWREGAEPIVRRPSRAAHINRQFEEVAVKCPECGSDTIAQLGIRVGSSAAPTCGQCAARFHVHRIRGGDVTTHPRGSAALETEDDGNDKPAI